MSQKDEIKPTAPRPPRRRCIIRITLQNTLLDNKYCIYKLLKRQKHCFTYLSRNIQDKRNYIVKFYRLDEIEDDDEMLMERYRVIKRMEVLKEINSPYVIKCYEVYANQSYMAAVYQYMGERSLKQQVQKNQVAKADYKFILQHIYHGMEAIHKVGIRAKQMKFENIFFKTGYYKIADFDLFLSDRKQVKSEKEPPTNWKVQSTFQLDQVQTDDVWELGMFYLNLIRGKKIDLLQTTQSIKCLFTKNLVTETSNILSSSHQELLKQCLMINHQQRIKWPQLRKLLQEKQKKQGDSVRKKRLTRTFLINNRSSQLEVNSSQNYKIQWEEVPQPGKLIEYIDESKQIAKIANFDPMFGNNVGVFSFKNVSKEEVQVYLSKYNDSSQEVYKELSLNHFEAQKSQYIFKNIVQPLQTSQLLDMRQQKNIQFMYMVCSRCFTNLSYIKNWLQKLDPQQKQENSNMIKHYQDIIDPLHEQYKNYFKKYSDSLTKTENEFLNKVKDTFKENFFYTKKEKKEEDKFLVGVEGPDYTKQEQIEYTRRKYLEKNIIIQEIKQKAKGNKQQKGKQVIKLLNAYEKICKLEDSIQIRGKQFQDCVQEIIGSPNKGQKLNAESPITRKNEQETKKIFWFGSIYG